MVFIGVWNLGHEEIHLIRSDDSSKCRDPVSD